MRAWSTFTPAAAGDTGGPLLTAIIGNSIAAQNKKGGAFWDWKAEVHRAQLHCGGAMRFTRALGATTRMDQFGAYGYSGATLSTILGDLQTQVFDSWNTAGLIPDLVVLVGLVENDIPNGETYANLVNYTRQLLTTVRRWPGVRIVLTTPHPSVNYDTSPKVAVYQQIRDHILSLDNGEDIFVARMDGYEDPADPGKPLSGYTDGVHPNAKGAAVTARQIANAILRIRPHAVVPDRLQHPNLALSGAISISGSNVTVGSTAPTGFAQTNPPAGCTVTLLAETPGLLYTVQPTIGQSGDSEYLSTGSQAVSGGANTQLVGYAQIEIVSGAENIRGIGFTLRISDGSGSPFQSWLSQASADPDPEWQNGDVLTFVTPPMVAVSGVITSVIPYLRCVAKTGGGANAIVGSPFTLRLKQLGVQVVEPYAQTYATADKTHANATQTAVATTGATSTTPFGYTTAAQADDIVTQLNNARADILDLKQLVNSVINDLKAMGLVG